MTAANPRSLQQLLRPILKSVPPIRFITYVTSVSARESDEVNRTKQEVLRIKFDEQARSEKRKTEKLGLKQEADSALKPWREVMTPHKDVQSGRFPQAEFAADLWQVYLNEGSKESPFGLKSVPWSWHRESNNPICDTFFQLPSPTAKTLGAFIYVDCCNERRLTRPLDCIATLRPK